MCLHIKVKNITVIEWFSLLDQLKIVDINVAIRLPVSDHGSHIKSNIIQISLFHVCKPLIVFETD